jgi:hypothetical protein
MHSNHSKWCTLGSGLLVLLLLVQISCVPLGSPRQAISARQNIASTETYTTQATQEISAYLNELATHPGIAILINHMYVSTIPDFPISPITYQIISQYFGEHREISPGVFETVRSFAESYIRVDYLSGEATIAKNFEFLPDASTALMSFTLNGIGVYYYNVQEKLIDGISILGYIDIDRGNGSVVDYNISHQRGGWYIEPCKWVNGRASPFRDYCDPNDVLDFEYIRGTYLEISEGQRSVTGNINTRSVSDTILYRQTNQPGLWIAKQTLKRISLSTWDSSGSVTYGIGIITNGSQTMEDASVISYQGTGNVRIAGFRGIPYKVAEPLGGPYTCDLSNPAAVGPGTGESVTLKWTDEFSEPLFPSTDLTCTDLIWQQ